MVPSPSPEMSAGGKPGQMVKQDDLTIEFQFENPYWLFELVLAGDMGPGRGQAVGQFHIYYDGGYAPKAYLSQFLPKYKPQAELDTAAKAANYTDWKARFRCSGLGAQPRSAGDGALESCDRSDITKPQWTAERNPYYWEVDTAGNSCPTSTRFSGPGRERQRSSTCAPSLASSISRSGVSAARTCPSSSRTRQRADYTVHIDPGTNGGDANIYFNFSYNEDPEIQKWILNKDFRRALSMATDRAQINEAFFLGLGTPGSPIPSPVHAGIPG